MKIIEATEKDIPALIELNEEALELHIELAPDKYKKIDDDEITSWLIGLQKDKSVKILIAHAEGKPVGYVIANIFDKKENAFTYADKFILVDHIVISNDSQCKGYGKILINEIKKYAKSLNINAVSLFVFAKNTSAVKAYEKLGFEPEGIKMTLKIENLLSD